MPLSPHLSISIARQQLELRKNGQLLMSASISSGKAGVGSTPNSGKTPLGRFSICSKHGENAPEQCYFTARLPRGIWGQDLDAGKKEGILTRILCLEGLEEYNSNTRQRYIYIHGTSDVAHLGQAASFGCIRLSPKDMKLLYSLCPLSTAVSIEA